MDIAGKVVLMTGAAGALGSVVARSFAECGAQVVLADRQSDRLAAVLGDVPGALLIGGIDVTSPAAVRSMVEQTLAARGRIDALINMAGTWRGGKPVHETALDTWDLLMNLNAKSVFITAQAVIPTMITQRYGKIVSIAAKSGLEGKANTSVYNASKSAVIRLTESLSAEVRDAGINVNCVLPTIIDSPANREQMPKADFSKWVTPQEMADILRFLCSDASRAIHGAAIPVNGRV